MSKEGYVPLQSYLERGTSQPENAEPQTTTKSGNAWGQAGAKKEPTKALSFAELQEAEKKKKQEEEKKKQEDRRQPTGTYKPRGARAEEPTGNYGSVSATGYGSTQQYGQYDDQYRGPPRREYTPREKNPVPTSPPYTAYIGNLPFEKASEEELEVWFGELGVEEIRVIRDTQTQQPRGYAYIQFKTREGLEDALKANGTSWGGRSITVDVATTKTRDDDRGRWGPSGGGGGNASGFSASRGGGFDGRQGGGGGDRFNESRYDSSGGSWRNQKPVVSSGPPRIDVAPRTKPVEDIGTTVKRGGEDPFGGASTDAEKLKRQAEERLKREQESERRKQETLERIQREREEKARSFGQAAAGKTTDSWRGREDDNRSSNQRGGRGGRGGSSSRGRYDNSWGPSDKSDHRAEKKSPQPSKAEAERADALVNPYDVLNNDDDKE